MSKTQATRRALLLLLADRGVNGSDSLSQPAPEKNDKGRVPASTCNNALRQRACLIQVARLHKTARASTHPFCFWYGDTPETAWSYRSGNQASVPGGVYMEVMDIPISFLTCEPALTPKALTPKHVSVLKMVSTASRPSHGHRPRRAHGHVVGSREVWISPV